MGRRPVPSSERSAFLLGEFLAGVFLPGLCFPSPSCHACLWVGTRQVPMCAMGPRRILRGPGDCAFVQVWSAFSILVDWDRRCWALPS